MRQVPQLRLSAPDSPRQLLRRRRPVHPVNVPRGVDGDEQALFHDEAYLALDFVRERFREFYRLTNLTIFGISDNNDPTAR